MSATTATHIFISIAAVCFAYLLLIIPMTKKLLPDTEFMYLNKLVSKKMLPYVLIILALFIYCIVIPSIMINTGSIYTNISNQDNFVLLKFISVIVTIFVIYYFLIAYSSKLNSDRPKIFGRYDSMSVIITILLICNIAEAVISQWSKSSSDTFDGQINLANAFLGLLLIMSLVYHHRSMSIWSRVGSLELISGITASFAIAYTFWNLLFRIQLLENTSILMFLTVSLLLPLYCMYAEIGDWLQIRSITLLFTMILMFGIGLGQSNLMPWYNDTGYDKVVDDKDIITQIFSNESLKIVLVVLGFIFAVISLRK